MKNERKNYVLPSLSLIAVAQEVMIAVGSGGAGEDDQLSKECPPGDFPSDDSYPDPCGEWEE